MPARIAIADPLPDEIEILPTVEALEHCWSVGASTEGHNRESGEGTPEETASPYSPPKQHSNTPTPPISLAASSEAPPLGAGNGHVADDGLDLPLSLQRRSSARYDHCEQLGATGGYNWQGRPDGITLHSSCEAPFYDSEHGHERRHGAARDGRA
jgi:hypothetical protein